MKLYRVFICFVFLGLLGRAAYSQTLDPKVIINDPLPGPACGGANPPCYDGSGPFMTPYGSPTGFVYDGATDLTSLTIEFTGVPTPPTPTFSCQTNIFSECGTSFDSGTDIETLFISPLTGFPGSQLCDFNDHLFGICPNDIAPGTPVSITFVPDVSATPEPASIFLFGTGLCSIFFAAKRRLNAQVSV
jgi:hypothetical protein